MSILQVNYATTNLSGIITAIIAQAMRPINLDLDYTLDSTGFNYSRLWSE